MTNQTTHYADPATNMAYHPNQATPPNNTTPSSSLLHFRGRYLPVAANINWGSTNGTAYLHIMNS